MTKISRTPSTQAISILAAVNLGLIVFALGGTTPAGEFNGGITQVRIFHAGSLSEPFLEIERQFEDQHKNIDLQREPSGSVRVMRKITDLDRIPDVAATSDYSLISDYLISKNFAEWYIQFAKNEIVIAYSEGSKYSKEIDENNWYKILRRPGVKFGFGDPNADPGGYRSLMAIQLAEEYYDNPEIFDEIVAANTTMEAPKLENGKYTIEAVLLENLFPTSTGVNWILGTVWIIVLLVAVIVWGKRMIHRKEIVVALLIVVAFSAGLRISKFSPQNKVKVGSMEVAMVPALEEGSIDYMFNYRSVAKQHDFKFLKLPDEINLSKAEYKENYQIARIRLTDGTIKVGKPIVYGITILNGAKHPRAAADFLNYLFGEDGQAVFDRMGQPPISPPITENKEKLPEELRPLVKQNLCKEGKK